jgi:ADP-ribose pyrophosphatase YjhB (NUDIX family)
LKFCSNCGSDHLEFIIPENDTYHRYVCTNCHTIHYQNPRLIVGCLATWENKILLCKRAIQPQKDLWNLPAGFLENGERAEEGALRETLEESKAKVDIVRLHVLYSIPIVNQVYLHFLARMKTPDFGTTLESSEVQLFDPKDIPWDRIAFQSTTFALKKYLEFGDEYNCVHIGILEPKPMWK